MLSAFFTLQRVFCRFCFYVYDYYEFLFKARFLLNMPGQKNW
ncbi:hypothetical protein RNAN_3424 [Rheinheimera nanhaiensis E407-8]|uniref:Uncharacterized protein n=1 Tax=Rheinheimera nanhaiensis E407-8 TaxID=562729 RepID=I1E272_9GAMM|nr:hypothetical protein RNAN_3424 [Rheinheimera nanhaiensis E407-8]